MDYGEAVQRLRDCGIRRLLIVSHALHFEHAGRWAAYGPYVREIDVWADLFETVTIVAPLRRGNPDKDSLPFSRANISVRGLPEVGGDTLTAKVRLIALMPVVAAGVALAMRHADAIHVRCPGNVGLIGTLLAPLFSDRLVAKFAGQWNGYVGEPAATALQRWVLGSRWWRGPVTVYGTWPNQPPHIVPFFTSMMTSDQVEHAARVAAGKQLAQPMRVLYSGTLQARKRVDALIDAVRLLHAEGAPLEVAIVGDGPEREAIHSRAKDLVERGVVRFVGSLPYEQALQWFEWAHVLVLPSRTAEGWPKVIAEGMCYGLACVGVAHGQVPAMLTGRGVLLPTGSPDEIAGALRGLLSDPAKYLALSRAGAEWAGQYSLDGLRAALADLLAHRWHVAGDRPEESVEPIAGRPALDAPVSRGRSDGTASV